MKQIFQSLRNGSTDVVEVPCPSVGAGQLLIQTSRTLISAGTERMLVDFGKASLVGKVMAQPERVRQVVDKMRTDGVVQTLESVMNKLDQPLALGYSNVGRVVAVGAGVKGFAVGDRVASNGKHAEMVAVPQNLCARIPDAVSDDEAAFTVIGAIALQGIRLANASLGEAVVVTGLGLIGLVAVQLLRAQGCRVLGIDFDRSRLALAAQFGADVVDLSAGADPIAAAHAFSRGRGVDAVIVTASSKSSDLMHQAAVMCRKRGRIVLVGVTGLELSRADFYEKELTFQVSCSYGPGRYDSAYEDKGQDYPVGFVRWTAQRNFEAVLDMMAARALDMAPLISHRFDVATAADAYELIGGSAPSLGVILECSAEPASLRHQTVALPAPARSALPDAPAVSFIGAGNYAAAMLMPAFKAANARLYSVASRGGAAGVHAGRKFGFAQTTTDTDAVLRDPAASAVVIATRHDSHAALACAAGRAGKHVFVEKPLALDMEQLSNVADVFGGADSPLLMVGFNRRFSPHAAKIKQLLAGSSGPHTFVMTVNAGAIPLTHWTQDAAEGGGRIAGEACHFIDLLRFLAGAPIVRVTTAAVGRRSDGTSPDQATIVLEFGDGSLGTVHYTSSGHKSFPKERLDVFSGGRVLQLDNFRRLMGYGFSGFRRMALWRQDKGQHQCAKAFVDAVRSGAPSPIPFDELIDVSRATIQAANALR